MIRTPTTATVNGKSKASKPRALRVGSSVLGAFARSFLVCVMIASLVACTTMQTVGVGDLQSKQVQDNVDEGDKVTVWTKSGDMRQITVTRLDEGMLYGRTDTGQPVQILRDQITRLDVEKFSILKTAGNTAKGLGVAVFAVFMLAFTYVAFAYP